MMDLKEIRQQVGIKRKTKSAFPVKRGHPGAVVQGEVLRPVPSNTLEKKTWKRD